MQRGQARCTRYESRLYRAPLTKGAAVKPTFIQVTELWTPTPDRKRLQFAGGLDGGHVGFAAAAQPGFGFDEGLPGKAWSQRRPIVLDDLQAVEWFRRKDEARAAGLTVGIALPIFAGDYLMAVVTFFFSDNEENVGTVELWHNDGARSSGMTLLEGHFGILEGFRFSSSHTTFMRGFGLPGMVWDSGKPVVMADLGQSKQFLRRDDARRIGINSGVGLPCPGSRGRYYVLAFLSALGTPIARRFEIWEPNDAKGGLVFKEGLCDRVPGFGLRYTNVVLKDPNTLLGGVLRTGLPAVSKAMGTEESPVGTAASTATLEAAVAVPMLDAGRLTSIVVMYF